MFEQLKKFLEGNEEGLKLVGSLESAQNELVNKVNSLEAKFEEAKTTRDKVKAQLREVKDSLGLENVDKDSLAKLLEDKDPQAVKELENLKTQLSSISKEKEDEVSQLKSKLTDYVMRTELSKTGLAQDALNSTMYSFLEKAALEGATYSDETGIVFKNPDGTTVYNGSQPMTLSDKVEKLKGSDDFAPMFKATVRSGSATKTPGVGDKKPEEYTEQERIALLRQNPAKFKEIFQG